jgi:hypothetical protein
MDERQQQQPDNPDRTEDWAEDWGRRIGRVLAIAVAVGLLIWLARSYLTDAPLNG